MAQLDITIDASGPVFDGRAEEAARLCAFAARRALAERAVSLVHDSFNAQIRVNRGVFISTITTTDVSRTYSWEGSWTRDVDTGPLKGTSERVSRTYTMPIEVTDPVRQTIVTTELAMYGPWLEGTGSRNLTTRFKGYHGFRKASQVLEVEAELIADRAIAPYVAEMNA